MLTMLFQIAFNSLVSKLNHQSHNPTVQDHLALMLKVNRYTPVYVRLDLPKAPARLARVTHQHPWF